MWYCFYNYSNYIMPHLVHPCTISYCRKQFTIKLLRKNIVRAHSFKLASISINQSINMILSRCPKISQDKNFKVKVPRGGTLRKIPRHDHSLNWTMTSFAYQTQTVADPHHIQSILPLQPLCTGTQHPFCTYWFFPSLSFYLSAIWSVNNQ